MKKSSSIKFRLNCFFVVSFDVLLSPHIKVLFAPSFNLFSEPIAPSVYYHPFTPIKNISAFGLSQFFQQIASSSKSNTLFASILLIRIKHANWKHKRIFERLVVTFGNGQNHCIFNCARVGNSAGQTRLPTFSSTTRSRSSVPNSSASLLRHSCRDGTFRAYEAELI